MKRSCVVYGTAAGGNQQINWACTGRRMTHGDMSVQCAGSAVCFRDLLRHVQHSIQHFSCECAETQMCMHPAHAGRKYVRLHDAQVMLPAFFSSVTFSLSISSTASQIPAHFHIHVFITYAHKTQHRVVSQNMYQCSIRTLAER